MSYTINKADGTILGLVPDNSEFVAGTPLISTGTVLDLTMYGRGRLAWGERVNENFVHLLENFASVTAPPNPIAGQIWMEKINLPLSCVGSPSGSPTIAYGQMWFFDGCEWIQLLSGLGDLSFGNLNVNGKLVVTDPLAACDSPSVTIQGPSAPVMFLENTGPGDGSTSAPAVQMYNPDNDPGAGGAAGTYGWSVLSNRDGTILSVERNNRGDSCAVAGELSFSVSQSDNVTVHLGDFTVATGDIDVSSGNLIVNNDATVTNGDLTVSSGDITVSTGDITVSTGDIEVSSGDIIISSGKAFSQSTTGGDLGTTLVTKDYYQDASHLTVGTLATGRLSGTYNIDITGNANTLDGQHGSYYRNSSNQNAGTLAAARLADSGVVPGSYTKVDLTVDSKGRITTIASGSAGEWSTQFSSGTGTNGIPPGSTYFYLGPFTSGVTGAFLMISMNDIDITAAPGGNTAGNWVAGIRLATSPYTYSPNLTSANYLGTTSASNPGSTRFAFTSGDIYAGNAGNLYMAPTTSYWYWIRFDHTQSGSNATTAVSYITLLMW